MRRTASEKMEIIRLVEGTDLPVRLTLRQMGVPRSTFYDWYQRYAEEGFDGLHDKKPVPRGRWNAIPEKIQKEVLDLALERSDLSQRELACRYTDENRYFVSGPMLWSFRSAKSGTRVGSSLPIRFAPPEPLTQGLPACSGLSRGPYSYKVCRVSPHR